MRVLLTSNAYHLPPRGGSTRSNLIWLRHLAANGHVCKVVCPGDVADEVESDGITIRRVPQLARQTGALSEEIRAFQPDWVLVSSEDLSHTLLREAFRAAPDRIVYLAHTPQFFPFGPESWNPEPSATALVRQARGVVAIGHRMAGYTRRHAGCDAAVIHPPIYGSAPYADFSKFGSGYVLMVNPCVVKGVSILLGLAEHFPQIPFAALIGWGTTPDDRDAMSRHPNITQLESVPHIEDVLRQSRLLLMPSLWYEGFGLIAMEAMLRGLPVISSDSGGLVEAKQGTGYVIPVQPIKRYTTEFDAAHMPKPEETPQNLKPWIHALHMMLSDRDEYEAESRRSRDSALRFVGGLDAADFEKYLGSLKHGKPMRILLAHNSLYYPSHGGGDRSNRLLMEALAARGHDVRVVARIEHFGEPAHAQYLDQLAIRGVVPESTGPEAVRMRLNGVDVHTLTMNPRLRAYFEAQIAGFGPDVIVTSTDDPAQLLFDVAMRAPRVRVVHLIRATIAVPFGPDASSPNVEHTARLRQADGVVGVSEYVAKYAREHGELDAIHVPISLMEPGNPSLLGRFDNPYVAFANPCAVKGIAIFLELARRMPDVRFAAVPTWGTTEEDRAALESLPNVTIIGPYDQIDDLFRQTRVLLVPSVWAEARSRIVLESLLRGVPVLASNTGGIPEAMCGVDYLLPVNPIVRYHAAVDEHMVPVPEVPPQDVTPWEQTLRRLISDPEHYAELSAQSRQASFEYLRDLNVAPFEAFLEGLIAKPKKAPIVSRPEELSPEKRRLLALRLKQRTQPKLPPATLRLFCFPWAGGGAAAYRGWQIDNVEVQPVRLPPVDEMSALVERLAAELPCHLGDPFAFFGHSMGAGIAFELTRWLRRHGKPLPKMLIVSAARAPQYRLNLTPPPEPTDDELIEQLRTLEGIPDEMLRLALPLLRADTRLYRNYVYTPEDPLPVPIVAYGGASDPNVRPEHLEAWSEQTTAGLLRREFLGGHFYFKANSALFLETLKADLAVYAR
jgi:surfactin synthase thioesterase subunit/glycosyltransferase involved in cell wall biosynthesis